MTRATIEPPSSDAINAVMSINNRKPRIKRMSESTATDWHPARIKYELALRGLSLADIGRRRGLAQFSIYDVLRKKVPLSEQAVAEALGVRPDEIWPSRYNQS